MDITVESVTFWVCALIVLAGAFGVIWSRNPVHSALSLVATLFTSLYPRVMVSSPDFANSLTVSGAASEHYTLKVMSVVALIFVPLILLYQSWTYYVFRARVTGEEVQSPAEVLARPPSGSPAS
jgi:cytochrome d ubiquinol oxidase subunit II